MLGIMQQRTAVFEDREHEQPPETVAPSLGPVNVTKGPDWDAVRQGARCHGRADEPLASNESAPTF